VPGGAGEVAASALIDADGRRLGEPDVAQRALVERGVRGGLLAVLHADAAVGGEDVVDRAALDPLAGADRVVQYPDGGALDEQVAEHGAVGVLEHGCIDAAVPVAFEAE